MSSPRTTKADVVAEFRRGQILEAARDCFARQGVAETTVDDIARAAGVAKGTVYLYYPSKDEILKHLLLTDLAELRDITVPSIREAGDIAARIQRYVTAMLEFFERKRDVIDHCQLELSPEMRKKVRAVLVQIYSEQGAAWTEELSAVAADHGIDAAAVAGAALNIVSLARGLAFHRLTGWSHEPIDEAATRASHLLWKGLATR